MTSPNIRIIQNIDLPHWLRMRKCLWPETPEAEHHEEVQLWLADLSHFPVFVADYPEEYLIGFLEASLQEIDPGNKNSLILYIEGWYVEPAYRKKGVGKKLIAHAEEWAKSHGFRRLISDTEADNKIGIAAHEKLGFKEWYRTETEIIFQKEL